MHCSVVRTYLTKLLLFLPFLCLARLSLLRVANLISTGSPATGLNGVAVHVFVNVCVYLCIMCLQAKDPQLCFVLRRMFSILCFVRCGKAIFFSQMAADGECSGLRKHTNNQRGCGAQWLEMDARWLCACLATWNCTPGDWMTSLPNVIRLKRTRAANERKTIKLLKGAARRRYFD